jgi:hypothetical protein
MVGEHLVIKKSAYTSDPVFFIRQNSRSGNWRVFDCTDARSPEKKTIKLLSDRIGDLLGIPMA